MFDAKLYLSMLSNPFGELVAKKRTELNLSQRELAQRIGKSATYINYVERGFNPASKGGKFQPSKEAVEQIAKVLHLDMNEALNLAGYASKERQFPPKMQELMKNLSFKLDEKNLTQAEKDELFDEVEMVFEIALLRLEKRKAKNIIN